jgi:hypothetical protein
MFHSGRPVLCKVLQISLKFFLRNVKFFIHIHEEHKLILNRSIQTSTKSIETRKVLHKSKKETLATYTKIQQKTIEIQQKTKKQPDQTDLCRSRSKAQRQGGGRVRRWGWRSSEKSRRPAAVGIGEEVRRPRGGRGAPAAGEGARGTMMGTAGTMGRRRSDQPWWGAGRRRRAGRRAGQARHAPPPGERRTTGCDRCDLG